MYTTLLKKRYKFDIIHQAYTRDDAGSFSLKILLELCAVYVKFYTRKTQGSGDFCRWVGWILFL